MLMPHLRRIDDNRLVPTSLAGLAMQVRGEVHMFREDAGQISDDHGHGPAVIIRCREIQDAQACMQFATRRGLLICLSNGSDSFRGADCDRGIAVDLSRIRFMPPESHDSKMCRGQKNVPADAR